MPIGCQFRGLFDFEGVARRTTESKKSKHREALAEREGVPQVWCGNALHCQTVLKVGTDAKDLFGALSNPLLFHKPVSPRPAESVGACGLTEPIVARPRKVGPYLAVIET